MALAIFLILVIASTSCGPTKVAPTETLMSPYATTLPESATSAATIAAQTIQPSLSVTTNPTATKFSATATSDNTAVPTKEGDSASFISDVTIPDGTLIAPGAPFTKTWRLANNGSTTWTTSYSLVYISGSLAGNIKSIPLSSDVKSGQFVDLSASFTAPQTAGQYTSLWMLRNESGEVFGIGPNSNEPIYLLINVSASGTANPNATVAPTTSILVTAASLSADQTSYSGSCPVTINLSGSISVDGSGSFVYQLEAGTSTPGFTFTLPAAQTSNYTTAGSHSLSLAYALTISSSVQGWVKLSTTSPNALSSNQVDLSITCK